MGMTEIQPPERKDWLTARKNCIGGSEIGTITGTNPYGCARALWYEKVGIPGSEEQEPTGVMRRGTILEPVAAEEFALHHLSDQWRYHKVSETAENVKFLSSKAPCPWMGGTPDYFLYELTDASPSTVPSCRANNPTQILEIKTANKWAFSQAKKIGGQLYHHEQVLWYLLATGLTEGKLFYLWPDGWESFKVDIALTDGDRERLQRVSRQFWEAVVHGRQSWVTEGFAPKDMNPELDTLSRLASNDKRCRKCLWQSICQPQGVVAEEGGAEPADMGGDYDWNSAASSYLRAQSEMDISKSRLMDARSLLEEKMGDEILAIGGGIRVSWKPSVRNSLDTTALKKAHPELASKFTKQTPTRSFRVTETGK